MTKEMLKKCLLMSIEFFENEKEKLSHILNKDEFNFLIEDRASGKRYYFQRIISPKISINLLLTMEKKWTKRYRNLNKNLKNYNTMTTEQLDKAKELQTQIESLKHHLRKLSEVRSSSKPYLRADSSNKWEDLGAKYLPINFEQYIGLYVQNVEKEIAKLEQEFKNL